MNGNNTYQDRQTVANTGEILFEQYCKDKNVFFTRFGFDEKNKYAIVDEGLNIAAEEQATYSTIPQLEKLIAQTKKQMEKAAKDLDFIVLTHAHIDHTGLLPKLVKEGFKGNIYCTPATKALTEVLLEDSAIIQRDDAKFSNKRRAKQILQTSFFYKRKRF